MKISRLGQVSIFIVIAVVVLGIVIAGLLIFKKGSSQEGVFSDNAEINAKYNFVKSQVYDCVKFVGESSLDFIGMQGGYYTSPKESYDFAFVIIPYYYIEPNRFLNPSKQEVEEQLSLFVNDNIKTCIDSIDAGDFKITYVNPITIVKIKEDSVDFSVNLPVTIKRELNAVQINLNDNRFSAKSRISEMMDSSKEIIDNHKQYSDLLCTSCISKISDEKGFFIEIKRFNLDEQITLIAIQQNDSESHPFAFTFLEKYQTPKEVVV